MKQIKASEVKAAMERARALSDDWQAQCLEILLLPAVQERWQKMNAERFRGMKIERHEGRPHKGFTREDNLAVRDWREFAGYVFLYSADGFGWNRVREDYYAHSPSSAWGGVVRETRCRFVESLRMLTLNAMGDLEVIEERLTPGLEEVGLTFVDDLDADLVALYKQESSGDWYMRAWKLSPERARRQIDIERGSLFYRGEALALVPFARDLPDTLEELPAGAESY